MNISPPPRFLYSIRADRGDVVRVCGEAVDNSLDAVARNIAIEISDTEIKFVDDGIGVLLKNIPALFTYGNHIALTSTKLGRFGVGITAQAINAANVLEVLTVSSDGRYRALVNWRHVLRDGFDQPDPVRLPSVVGAATGTIIKLTALRKLRHFTIDKVVEDLAERFYPALAEGRTITVNGIPVPLLSDPPLTDVIEQSFEFRDGRSATLRAGLLATPSKMNRVHVAFGHRVIMPASRLGCGSYVGLSNMFARVQLGGSYWALSSFKTDLTDEDQREELEQAIEDAITPILEKCGTVSIEARVAVIGELMNEMLPPEMKPARPHHRKKKGPTTSSGGGRKNGAVDSAKADLADGPAKTRRPQDCLLITWEGKNADHGIGWFEPGRTNCVHLSRDNPDISELFQVRDDTLVARAALIIAVQLFEEGRALGELKFKSFGLRVAQHLLANTIANTKIKK